MIKEDATKQNLQLVHYNCTKPPIKDQKLRSHLSSSNLNAQFSEFTTQLMTNLETIQKVVSNQNDLIFNKIDIVMRRKNDIFLLKKNKKKSFQQFFILFQRKYQQNRIKKDGNKLCFHIIIGQAKSKENKEVVMKDKFFERNKQKFSNQKQNEIREEKKNLILWFNLDLSQYLFHISLMSIRKDLDKLIKDNYKKKLQVGSCYRSINDPFLEHYFNNPSKKKSLVNLKKRLIKEQKNRKTSYTINLIQRTKSFRHIKKRTGTKKPFLRSSINYTYDIENKKLYISHVTHQEFSQFLDQKREQIVLQRTGKNRFSNNERKKDKSKSKRGQSSAPNFRVRIA